MVAVAPGDRASQLEVVAGEALVSARLDFHLGLGESWKGQKNDFASCLKVVQREHNAHGNSTATSE